MTPEEAAASLDRELRQYPWYITTGIGSAKGSTALFVYTKVARTKTLSFLERGWEGYPVVVKVTGAMRPAAHG